MPKQYTIKNKKSGGSKFTTIAKSINDKLLDIRCQSLSRTFSRFINKKACNKQIEEFIIKYFTQSGKLEEFIINNKLLLNIEPLLGQSIFIDTCQKKYKIRKHLDFHILRPVS